MSRKKKFTAKTEETIPIEIPKEIPQLFPSLNVRMMALIVFIFSCGLYFNTISNEYALDDGIVITENAFTKKGLAGIKEIFAQQTFANVSEVNTELSGGRYRPLSVAMFAIEYQFFGPRPSVNHLVNVLLYGFLCVLLFYFLKQYVFKEKIPVAFIATILFAAHPLHTDVVSNIKGRDEILCLLLLMACLLFYLEYAQKKKFLLLIASLATYFLSLLSKENGITFLAVIPLLLYFFMNKRLMNAIVAVFPFILVFVGYLMMRLSITGFSQSSTQEVMNAPFVKAIGDEAFATKVMILGKDLWMLAFPHPLSYDYSYNQIPYVHFSDWRCLLSILANGVLVFFAVKLFNKRHIISFAILFYFVTLSIISNFVFDVGSPFNERFLFQPSIGFAIAIAFLIGYLGTLKGNYIYKAIAISFFLFLAIAGSIKTILRNPEWKNNESLFTADVRHAPNSAKTNNHAGVAFLKMGERQKDTIQKNKYFEMAIPYFKRALQIYPEFADPNIDLGDIYALQGKFDLARESLLKAKAIYPDNHVLNINLTYVSQQYQAQAMKFFAEKNYPEAIRVANLSLDCNPNNVFMLYNLGGYYLNMHDVEKAKELWTRALAIDPNNSEIKTWLNRISTAPPVKN